MWFVKILKTYASLKFDLCIVAREGSRECNDNTGGNTIGNISKPYKSMSCWKMSGNFTVWKVRCVALFFRVVQMVTAAVYIYVQKEII